VRAGGRASGRATDSHPQLNCVFCRVTKAHTHARTCARSVGRSDYALRSRHLMDRATAHHDDTPASNLSVARQRLLILFLHRRGYLMRRRRRAAVVIESRASLDRNGRNPMGLSRRRTRDARIIDRPNSAAFCTCTIASDYRTSGPVVVHLFPRWRSSDAAHDPTMQRGVYLINLGARRRKSMASEKNI